LSVCVCVISSWVDPYLASFRRSGVMKLLLVAALLGAAAADTFRPSGHTAPSGHSAPVYQEQFAPSAGSAPSNFQRPQQYEGNYNNYYDNSRPQAPGIIERFFGGIRRQDGIFGIGGAGIGGFGLAIVIIIVGLAVLAGAAAIGSITSSGRGLDSDDWEVDHSVWMDQLQKDFEDSWSTE